MAREAIAEFARRLLGATTKHSLKWQRLDQPNAYTATAAGGSVVVERHQQTAVTKLTIRKADGEIIEAIETEPSRPGAWLDWESTLNQLYDEAELSALGTTEVLEDLAREWNLPPDPANPPPPAADDDIPF